MEGFFFEHIISIAKNAAKLTPRIIYYNLWLNFIVLYGIMLPTRRNKMPKKNSGALGANIKSFIFGNDMSRSEFAELLNDALEKRGVDLSNGGYDENDIWTYDSRGSMPRDVNVFAAIAEIIGKPLEDLLTREFTMEELKCDLAKRKQAVSPSPAWVDWNIERLNELSESERNFILDLVSNGAYEEDGHWQSYFDILLRYNQGKTVTVTCRYGDLSEEKTIEWSWNKFGSEVDFWNDEATVVERMINHEFIDKLYAIGLLYDFYCVRCDLEDLEIDDEGEKPDGYFVARVFYDISKSDIIEIIKLYIERLKSQIALIENDSMLEVKATREEK